MLEQIKEIVAESLNVEADTLTTDTSFKEDLGADSLDLFELVMALEDEYSVEIPAAPAHKIVAATMRSGMIVCSTNGCGRKPLTVTVDVPAPEMRAPSLRR